ncbi:hypothetical protein ACRE_045130 [Hapsidospora chrysogenum ATCC 11550]|uniref:Uncharacterized protein n=1 Tax=Hapsidospora chrysogenum (strain ATCC 11550 / CBS 779.69 / DSM 880 / IAM 14645 / JCM 23072 / IMI 49137) TaxID=857340 RepID=A0A086T5Q9_HAPC1|nr:hypothetical protein ACRE_045130 [Hapsidospora chrysogenum ATCC 11550]
MFSTLPDLTQRDPHSLWYTSSRSPVQPFSRHDAGTADHGSSNNNNGSAHRHRSQVIERTPLHRLALDEFYMARRKVNVANFGSHWLKPPGIAKTLHQMREEKREQEEHAEAVRREQLAQELAEAGAEGMPEDGMMHDVELEEAPDLDDDIPDAGDDFMMDGDEDDEDEDEEEDVDEDEDDDHSADEEALREERRNGLVAARMRMTDDAFREALVRGDPDGGDMYGGEEELHEESEGHLLGEDDFVPDGMMSGDGDMDADLDDDIPEAESGGYEHTDSEAELSSSEDGGMAGYGDGDDDDNDDDDDDDGDGEGGGQDIGDIGFGRRAAPLGPPQSPTLRGRSSLSAPRHSLDLSSILSQDESSYMVSSPVQARRARHG